MYRAIAWEALQKDVDLNDEKALGALSEMTKISFGHSQGDPVPKQVFIDGKEITNEIRTAEIDKAVSPVSAASSVRKALVLQQQRIGNEGN